MGGSYARVVFAPSGKLRIYIIYIGSIHVCLSHCQKQWMRMVSQGVVQSYTDSCLQLLQVMGQIQHIHESAKSRLEASPKHSNFRQTEASNHMQLPQPRSSHAVYVLTASGTSHLQGRPERRPERGRIRAQKEHSENKFNKSLTVLLFFR